MTKFDHILMALGLIRERDAKASASNAFKRAFAAASQNRLVADWNPWADQSMDADLRFALPALRNRAREMCKNDGIARNFIREIVRNVVGPYGFKLRMKISENGVRDKIAETLIQEAFGKWSRGKFVTVDGKNTFRSMCKLAMKYVARDGEVFLRRLQTKKNSFGITTQFIEPELVDDSFTTELGDNLVIMGIEFNPSNQVVAYHIKKTDATSRMWGYQDQQIFRYRVPSEQIIHFFDPDFYTQSRGFTWFAPAAIQMRMRKGYAEATLARARFSASVGGVITQDKELNGQVGYDGDEKDEKGNTKTDVEAGMLKVLAPGQSMIPYDTDYPTAAHGPFMKDNGREIAAALGPSYASLFQDFSDGNYSSLRQALLPERDNYMDIQESFIEQFANPLFTWFLDSAMLAGAIVYPSGKQLPFSKFEKFNSPVFYGRRWPWVDPEKDGNARRADIGAGFSTWTETIAELGGDRDEIFEELEQDYLEIKTRNIPVNLGTATKQEPVQQDSTPATNGKQKFAKTTNGVH